MTSWQSCLYRGAVVHRRFSPVRHRLRYDVYSLFVDIDELATVDRRLRVLSYNEANILSIHDKDHGPGDGTSIADHVWGLVRASPVGEDAIHVFMLCYPRVLGFVFNPLTVYYALRADGRVCLMIYEVSNTFGQRHTYVIPADNSQTQSCRKEFYVSPFNAVEGRYDFRFDSPAEKIFVGITLRLPDRPILNAYFHGSRRPLTDAALLKSFASLPVMTLKVLGAIHFEALKLWLKGLRPRTRPKPPLQPVSFANSSREIE